MSTPAQPFRYDASEKPALNYFTSSDGKFWCTVNAYGLIHTIGPYELEFSCIKAAKAQVALNLTMAKEKVKRGDQAVPLW